MNVFELLLSFVIVYAQIISNAQINRVWVRLRDTLMKVNRDDAGFKIERKVAQFAVSMSSESRGAPKTGLAARQHHQLMMVCECSCMSMTLCSYVFVHS